MEVITSDSQERSNLLCHELLLFHMLFDPTLLQSIIENRTDHDIILTIETDSLSEDTTGITKPHYQIQVAKRPILSFYIKQHIPSYKKITSSQCSETCSICLATFSTKEYQRTLPCSHMYHKKCIDQWFRRSDIDNLHCPVCRHSFAVPVTPIQIITNSPSKKDTIN